jgi:hypothetical protein
MVDGGPVLPASANMTGLIARSIGTVDGETTSTMASTAAQGTDCPPAGLKLGLADGRPFGRVRMGT